MNSASVFPPHSHRVQDAPVLGRTCRKTHAPYFKKKFTFSSRGLRSAESATTSNARRSEGTSLVIMYTTRLRVGLSTALDGHRETQLHASTRSLSLRGSPRHDLFCQYFYHKKILVFSYFLQTKKLPQICRSSTHSYCPPEQCKRQLRTAHRPPKLPPASNTFSDTSRDL